MHPSRCFLISATCCLLGATSAGAQAPETVAGKPGTVPEKMPAAAVKPAPVQFTALKKTPWPPKSGVKTPGVQIPMVNLHPEAEIVLPGAPGPLQFTTQVLIPVPAKDTVVRVDARTNKAAEPIAGVKQPCGGLASAFGGLWIPGCGAGELGRFETRSGKPVATLGTGTGHAVVAVASTSDSVWMLTDDKSTLSRIDPETNSVVSEVRLPDKCRSVTAAESSLWIVCPGEKKIIRFNPQTGLVAERIEVSPEPVALAAGEGSIWVLSRTQGKVARIDPKTNKVTATVELGYTNADGNLAVGETFVWVTGPGFPITKISTQADKEKVVQQFAGDGGGSIAFGLGSVWLSNTAYNNVWRLDPKRIAATLAE